MDSAVCLCRGARARGCMTVPRRIAALPTYIPSANNAAYADVAPGHQFEIIIFWSDEDQAFVADVPELPGCMAHGGTHEAALAAVKDAIALWLETAHATGCAVPPVPGEQPPP